MTVIHITEFGLAEPVRLLLAYSEKEFIDKYVSDIEWDTKYRARMLL